MRRVLSLRALSLYALFGRGVVQMLDANSDQSYFASNDTLTRFYALGGGSGFDLLPPPSTEAVSPVAQGSWVLHSAGADGCELQEVLMGSLATRDAWGRGWEGAAAASSVATSTLSYSRAWRLAANDRNFPSGVLGVGPNLPEGDLEAQLTGVYGSSPGCLCTYDNEVVKGRELVAAGCKALLVRRACVGDAEDVMYSKFVVKELTSKKSSSFNIDGHTGAVNGPFGGPRASWARPEGGWRRTGTQQ